VQAGSKVAPYPAWTGQPGSSAGAVRPGAHPPAPEEPDPLCPLRKEEIKAIAVAPTMLGCYNAHRNGA